MLKPIGKATTLTLSMYLLSACGGSSDDDATTLPGSGIGSGGIGQPAQTSFWHGGPDPAARVETLNTYLLDGAVVFNAPVSGALVCIDSERDFTCDHDSPTAITSEDGRYTLQVDLPLKAAEFNVLTSFPVSQLSEGLAGAEAMAVDGEVQLSARAYYGGTINPATTLEALQYDPSLNYIEQVERFAMSRTMVSELYQLPSRLNLADAFNQEGFGSRSAAEWAEWNDQVLANYARNQNYIGSPYYALRMTALGGTVEAPSEVAQWLGLEATSESLTNSQRAMVEQYLTEGQRVVASLYNDHIEVINEPGGWLSELERFGDGYRYYQSTWSNGQDAYPQLCWHPEQARWNESSSELSGYSAPVRSGETTYTITNYASGAKVSMVAHRLDIKSSILELAMQGWGNTLNFTEATVDNDLLRVRYELENELCIESYGNSSSQAIPLSELGAEDIVALTNPAVHQQGLFEVSDTLQRITLTRSGFKYDYRVITLGDIEVLLLVAVHSSVNGSYPVAWVWQDGVVSRTFYLPTARFNQGLSMTSRIIMTDQAATDLREQMRGIAN